MNTMHRGTKARRTTLWSTLGAVAFVIGSSASAHAVDPTAGYLRTTPTFVGSGKSIS